MEVCEISTRALSTGLYGLLWQIQYTSMDSLQDYVVLKAANKAKLSHFCSLYDRGMIQNHFKFLVMNRVWTELLTIRDQFSSSLELGENLYKLRLQFQQCRFSAPTALRLSLEMLGALEELHSLGFVHRDVKPSNFAMQEEKGQASRVILLDFGLCRQFRTPGGEVKPPRENTQFRCFEKEKRWIIFSRGTLRYASLAAHRAQEQSPKDDLESWLYVVVSLIWIEGVRKRNNQPQVEFMAGELPWGTLHSAERAEVRRAKEQARTGEGMVRVEPKGIFPEIAHPIFRPSSSSFAHG